MKTIKQQSMIQNEVKKSTFIAYLVPILQFESLQKELKSQHQKAAHIVWAKRYLNEHEQIVENCSDDGEPKGTSGPPILNVMRGAMLIECAILIVRYFGGIKLGTGGLVRAYGGGAKSVIKEAEIVSYIKKKLMIFKINYALVPRFEYFIDKKNILTCGRDYEADGIVWKVDVSEDERVLFLEFASSFERDGFTIL